MITSYSDTAPVSPIVIADSLITLAQQADRAGYRDTAASLVTLMYSVLDQPCPTACLS